MEQRDYLEAMGIQSWVLRDNAQSQDSTAQVEKSKQDHVHTEFADHVVFTCVVDDLQGDAAVLFQKIIASLGLSDSHVQVLSSSELPVSQVMGRVMLVMGKAMPQKALGLDEPFEELLGSIHSYEQGSDEWPAVLTYDPAYLLKNPKKKADVWRDLMLAKSLL